MAQKFKITYQTFASPNPEVDRLFEETVARVKTNFGGTFPVLHQRRTTRPARYLKKLAPPIWICMGTFYEGSAAV